jgi:hypothetical protein
VLKEFTKKIIQEKAMSAYVAPTSSTSPSAGNPATSGPGRRSRRRLVKIVAGVAGGLAVLIVLAMLASGSAGASTAPARNWIGTGWNVHLAYQADPATTKHFFSAATSFGTGPSSAASPVTDGFSASAAMYYSSYAQFQSDLSSGAITYPYKWVMYDPEGWAGTPAAEQHSPVKYLGLFARLAHAKGYKVIATPARDLGNVATTCPLRTKTGESLDQWYIRCKIAAAAAAADVYVVQDQVNTTSITRYQSLFNQARAQAIAVNPAVQVDAEVSTNYGTATQMAAAAQSVPSASGFYLSTTTAGITQTTQFLQKMQTAGY